MAGIDCSVDWPGCEHPLSCDFSLSHGITPSVATLTMDWQPTPLATHGTLTFIFGSQVLQFPGCRADRLQQTNTSSGQVWTLAIKDRRWKWQYGEISGVYNIRDSSGELIPTLEKNPQELAQLCLQAMGESAYDVSALPVGPRPEVDWTVANPAEELAELCDAFGCRVVLGVDNVVRIVRIGQGAELPDESAMNASFGFDPDETPDSLKLVTGRTKFQTLLVLEPVGMETRSNGSRWVPIDSLSYRPSDGWETEHPEFMPNVAEGEPRQLAIKHVFKAYRVKEQFGLAGQLKPPGFPAAVNHLWQILPLDDKLLQTFTDDSGEERPQPARVFGRFLETYKDPPAYEPTDYDGTYTGRFEIDVDRGIVLFDEPVYLIEDDQYKPAELVLEASYAVKHPETRVYFRHGFERGLGQAQGTGPQIIRRDDIVRKVRAEYTGLDPNTDTVKTLYDNLPEITAQAEYYLNAAQAEYDALQTSDRTYMGLVPISPDGAIQQVTFTLNDNGFETRASRGTEHSIDVPPYEQRRFRERSQTLSEKQIERIRRENQKRRERNKPHDDEGAAQ